MLLQKGADPNEQLPAHWELHGREEITTLAFVHGWPDDEEYNDGFACGYVSDGDFLLPLAEAWVQLARRRDATALAVLRELMDGGADPNCSQWLRHWGFYHDVPAFPDGVGEQTELARPNPPSLIPVLLFALACIGYRGCLNEDTCLEGIQMMLDAGTDPHEPACMHVRGCSSAPYDDHIGYELYMFRDNADFSRDEAGKRFRGGRCHGTPKVWFGINYRFHKTKAMRMIFEHLESTPAAGGAAGEAVGGLGGSATAPTVPSWREASAALQASRAEAER